MRTLFKKATLALSTGLYLVLASTPVMADDTELFLGLNSGTITARPNIVFIIDTSGSMSSSVVVTTGTYDPTTTYSGSCVNTRYYYSTNGNPPTCSTNYYIETSSFYCNDAATALGTSGTGYYVGRFARYRNGRSSDYWTSLYSRDHTSEVECEADYGEHGNGTDTVNLYPADSDNNGPWRLNGTGAIDWSRTGRSYTFYTGNYLNWVNTPGVSQTMTRLAVVQQVLKDLINSTSGINAALMRFDNRSTTSNLGGYFVEEMQEINDTTRAGFNATVDLLAYGGYTPLAETLYEAMLYYRGDSVYFGNSTSPATNVSEVLDPSDSSLYKSPIDFQCQKNFVVLLTDGEPTYDYDADTQINSLTGFTTLTGGCDHRNGDNCLDELAQYMYETDQRPDMNSSQNIITYTIGFATDQTLLQDTARKGGSTGGIGGVGYFTANSVEGLTNAFTTIIMDILNINTTFVAPAVSVNAFNRLTHRDELYFALFQPATGPRWPGNLKRYKLMRSDPTDLTSELIVADINDTNAVDAETGFFSDTSQSYWSSVVDGPDVTKGGAAENLPLDRNVYTYTPSTDPNNSSLATATNRLHEDNDASVTGGTLTNTLLGLDPATTDADRIELIKWARGIDVYDDDEDGSTTDARNFMGDPLHSKPVVVTYAGTDETNLDVTIYMTTNEGHLHAIDADNGVETFSFIPAELLTNLDLLRVNATSGDHAYGLDGPVTVWHNDLNHNLIAFDNNGNLESTNGVNEHIYLYMGMRRGGNNYYALDITNRNNPLLKWVIKGGVANSDFEELAQTWSKPTFAKIMFGGSARNVLIFGGGYDESEDSASLPQDDTVGRAIYIVDAETGQRLWWAGPSGSGANLELSDMRNSIAANIRTVDANLNGYVDRLYTADLGGRIWRIDLDENHTGTNASTLATGGAIANLRGTDAANNRRFYYAPSISFGSRVGERYYAIAIGSGFRAHPLDTVIHDRFYVIRDTDVDGPPTDSNGNVVYTTLTEADLYDATDNIIGEGSESASAAAVSNLNASNGWYVSLNEPPNNDYIGEKVMSSPVAFAGVVLFPTYTPVASSSSTSCAPSQGTTYGYVLDLYDGTPVFNYDSDPSLTRADRRAEFKGLPTEPSIIFTEGGVTAFFGTQQLPTGISDGSSNRCTTLTCLMNSGEGRQGGRQTRYITESVEIQ